MLLLGLMAEVGGGRARLGKGPLGPSCLPSPAARPLPSPADSPGSQWQPPAGFHGSGKN